jgi:hypothetical protein
VKVDTSKLDASYGEISTLFMHVLSPSSAVVSTSGSAIAGPSLIKVVPLALCAMRPQAALNRSGELVEYGFRRGVTYDLMNLNPDPAGPGMSFVINPLTPPDVVGAPPSSDIASVKPFVCTGTMAMSRVTGGTLTVESSFPLGDLFTQLNSRFDTYSAPCNQYSAPPDANIKAYVFNNNGTNPLTASVPWMKVVPSGQAATTSTDGGKLWTIADPDATPAGTTGPMYGPLWSYAKAAKYAASPDSAGGYSTFATTDWATLYSSVGPPEPKNYPATGTVTTPYEATSGTTYFQAPSATHKGLRGRRVLNVALLSCPVASGRGTVVGIGKFFMTVPATASSLWAEFAGLAPEQSLGSQVELHQ